VNVNPSYDGIVDTLVLVSTSAALLVPHAYLFVRTPQMFDLRATGVPQRRSFGAPAFGAIFASMTSIRASVADTPNRVRRPPSFPGVTPRRPYRAYWLRKS